MNHPSEQPRRVPGRFQRCRRWTAGTLSLAALLLTVACAGHGENGPAPGSRLNVLIIVVDTLRRDHLGTYGYERAISPNIDALAAGAVRYEQAVSQSSWTTPAIAALMSSMYPTTLGISNMRSILDDDVVMLAETLHAAGYVSQGVISHAFCSAKWNFDQGFDWFDESSIMRHNRATSPSVTRVALEFLDAHHQEPFFLWLHYFDPHGLYLLHEEFDPTPDKVYEGVIHQNLGFAKLSKMFSSLNEEDIQQIVRAYDSEIAYTDHHIGMVLDHLRDLNVLENTIIVFTADHGEEFGDHGEIGHARTLYQELVNVPLIVKYPGRPPAAVSGAVALIDVYPTLLRELGLAAPEGIRGRPLPRSREEISEPDRIVFTETSRKSNLRAAVSAGHKLIRHLPEGPYEFYDLVADPGEHDDLAAAGGDEFQRHQQALNGWMRQMAQARKHAARVDLSEEEIQRLRSLGYADGGGD